jgi:cytochrome c-type biogenesis protein CcmH/NrfF
MVSVHDNSAPLHGLPSEISTRHSSRHPLCRVTRSSRVLVDTPIPVELAATDCKQSQSNHSSRHLNRPPQKRVFCLIFALYSTPILALFFAFPSLARAQSQYSPRVKAIGTHLKCMCGGCNDTVSSCNHSGGAFAGPCDTAKAMLKEIDQRVARGESDDLIMQDFVQEYGPTVLIEPPKAGFDWLAWIMPVALPIIAFVIVWIVVTRWRHRATLAVASGPPISPELLARARREEGNLDD